MSIIPISRNDGLEPHLIKCTRCRGDNGLSIGVMMQAEHEGQTVYANKGKTFSVKDKDGHRIGPWTHVPAEQKYITMSICPKCEDELAMQKQVVTDGGVYFFCEECRNGGVIKANSPMSHAVRHHTKIEAPTPVGITFSLCKQHGTERTIN